LPVVRRSLRRVTGCELPTSDLPGSLLDVFSFPNPVSQIHVLLDLSGNVRLLTNSQMVDVEPVSQIVDLLETSTWIRLSQHQMNVNEIRTDLVYRAKSHPLHKCDSCLDRMQSEATDLLILSQKIPEEID